MNLKITHKTKDGLVTDVVHVQPRNVDRSTLLTVDAQGRTDEGMPSGAYKYVAQLHDVVAVEVVA